MSAQRAVKNLVRGALFRASRRAFRWEPAPVFELFHEAWYQAGGWNKLTWFGVPILKNPFDLIRYQDILYRRRPDFLVECGAKHGGSTLYFAHILDAIGHGSILSIDIEAQWHPRVLAHPRVTTFVGSSVDEKVVAAVRERIQSNQRAMVILDSDHSRDHVMAELRSYSALVQPGDYLIVEDSNVNGHPVRPEFGPGPYEAAQDFLRESTAFELDPTCEYPFTFAPSGWLRRVGGAESQVQPERREDEPVAASG
jgi:cephalosporin hydroxylase